MKKKISIICNYNLTPDRIGGMDRFFISYNKELIEKGYEVDWFFTNVIHYHFYNDLIIYNAKNISVEEKFIEVSISENKNYQVIITHFIELCTRYFKNFKKIHQQSYIIAVDHNPRPLGGFAFKKKIKKRIQSYLYSQYIDLFIGVSQYAVNQIIKDYGNRISKKVKVIHNGVDTTIYGKRKNINRGKFLVASHLRHSKGIQDLLSALSIIDQKHLTNILIDIYGEGNYKEELVKLVELYDLNDVVSFKGSVSNLNEVISNYSYLIQPTYMECFSLSILESLCSNVPVITTTVGGNLEVVENNVNGFIFSPQDKNELAKIIEEILLNKKFIETDTSILITQKFTLQKMVDGHIKILP